MALPKYEQIRKLIVEEIRIGKLKVGEKLPTREEMLRKYGVTRTTLDKAISDLNQRKILKSTPKLGTFVASEPKIIRAAILFHESYAKSAEIRASLYDFGLLYYAMLTTSNEIEYHSIDIILALANPDILESYDIAIWVQPTSKALNQIEKIKGHHLILNCKIPEFNYISTDHSLSAFEVTDYYINKYKRSDLQPFYLYSSKSIKMEGKERLNGFIEACAKHNQFYRIIDLDGGHYTITRELLNMNLNFEKPSFFLAGSKKYTGAILKLAKEKKLTLGQNLFYCDYDNYQSLDRTGVEFTSIIQDYYELGRQVSLNLHKICKKELVHLTIPYVITSLQ